jgi:IS5 family transposase
LRQGNIGLNTPILESLLKRAHVDDGFPWLSTGSVTQSENIAIADAKGRLLSLLLTDGAAHDCPTAQPLVSMSRVAKRLLGDKAYDRAELRQWLRDRGTSSVIPNRSNRKQPFRFSKKWRWCTLSRGW